MKRYDASDDTPDPNPLYPEMPIAHAEIPAALVFPDWICLRRIRAGHGLFDSLPFVSGACYERRRRIIHGNYSLRHRVLRIWKLG